MSIANIWLGSVQLQTVTLEQAMLTNSAVLTSVVQSQASMFDWLTVKCPDMTETVTISLIPYVGTAYSTLLFKTYTSGVSNIFYQADRPLTLYPGDQIKAHVSNGDTTGTVYISLRTVL